MFWTIVAVVVGVIVVALATVLVFALAIVAAGATIMGRIDQHFGI